MLTRNAAVDEGHVLHLSDEEMSKRDKLMTIAEAGLATGLYALLRKQRREVAAEPEQLLTIVADYTPSLVAQLAAGFQSAWQIGVGDVQSYLDIELNTRLLFSEGRNITEGGAVALAQALNGRTIRNVQDSIRVWKEIGSLYDLLAATYSQQRAESIAITEMTRYNAQGALRGYQSSNVVLGMFWLTSNDSRVCFICAPLGGVPFDGDVAVPTDRASQKRNGQRASLYDTFIHPGGKGDAAKYFGIRFFPAAHVKCRCRIGPVVR